MSLHTLLEHPNALPAAPKVVEELVSSFAQEDVSTLDIAAKLSMDPVLSAKLLRLANSAYYHVSRRIGNVEDAISMLGFVTVRTLVISAGLVGGFKPVPGLELKRFWRYSLHSAVVAKWLARKVGVNPDLAFTIGMMHALGELVMHSAMPEQSSELDRTVEPYDPGRLLAETAAFGFNFSQVGAELALHWKFPDVFAETIRDFPDPLAQSPFSRMAGVLHLAVWRARAHELQLDQAALAASAPRELAQQLGLSDDELLLEMPTLQDLSAGLEELIH